MFRAAVIADIRATEEPGYWTFRSGPNPVRLRLLLQAPALLVRPQLLRADHARVEEAGLVEVVALLGVLMGLLLRLVGVVGGLLGVVPLVGVGVGLLVAVRVLLLGIVRLLREARVRVRLLRDGIASRRTVAGGGGVGRLRLVRRLRLPRRGALGRVSAKSARSAR